MAQNRWVVPVVLGSAAIGLLAILANRKKDAPAAASGGALPSATPGAMPGGWVPQPPETVDPPPGTEPGSTPVQPYTPDPYPTPNLPTGIPHLDIPLPGTAPSGLPHLDMPLPGTAPALPGSGGVTLPWPTPIHLPTPGSGGYVPPWIPRIPGVPPSPIHVPTWQSAPREPNGAATYQPGMHYRKSVQKSVVGPDLSGYLYRLRQQGFELLGAWDANGSPVVGSINPFPDWPAEDSAPRVRIDALFVGPQPLRLADYASTYVYLFR